MIDLPLEPALQPQEPTRVAEIIVRAARIPPLSAEAAFAEVQIDAEKVRRSQRIDQALGSVPAATLFRRADSLAANPTTQGLSLRAIAPTGAGRALVTLDGVPINDPFGGWVIWGQIIPEGIGRLDLVRGAGSGPYGAGALTGTVRLEESDQEGGLLDFSAGSRGALRAAALGRVQAGRAAVTLAGSHETSDGYVPVRGPAAGLADVPMDLLNQTLSGRLDYGFDNDVQLSIRAAGWEEDRGSGLGSNRANASGHSVSATLARSIGADGLSWKLQAWEIQSNLFNSSGAVSADRNTVTPANVQYRTPARGRGANAALRGETGLASGQMQWEVGLDARFNDGETQELFRYMQGEFTRGRRAGGEASVVGGYVDASWRAGPWLLAGGLRLDQWENKSGFRIEDDQLTGAVTLDESEEQRRDEVMSARFGIRRAMGNGWSARAAAYSGFRPATLNELHRPFRVGNDLTEANAALVPEKLKGLDIGVGHEGTRHALSASVFANTIEDVVVNVTLAQGPGTFPRAGFVPDGGVLRQRQNAGTVEAVGVELSGEYRIADTLTVRGALAWTDAEMDGGSAATQLTGLRPAQAPEWSGNVGADWQATPTLMLAVTARYESDRYDDDLNLRVLKAGWTVDARAEWQVVPNAAIWLAADNLLDEEIETSMTATGVAGYTAPRTVRAGVRLSY